MRQERAKPLVGDLHDWLREQRTRLSSKDERAKAIELTHRRDS
ncbi:MAG: hypothetical protein JNL66_13905 [Alphaproteobacteria bacterium]|nr:hypothetical protein [Alphaproteobacteria bacterium]